MKYSFLLATVAALRVRDAPPFFSEPTWKQTWPSAAGLVQLQDAPPAF